MMEDSFYVVLPSNVSGHTENTAGNFRVDLPKSLVFEKDYEVALIEITYPNTFFVLPVDQYITINISTKETETPVSWRLNGTLKAGNYESFADLCGRINELVLWAINRWEHTEDRDIHDRYQIFYVLRTHKVIVSKIQDDEVKVDVVLSKTICELLGLDESGNPTTFADLNWWKNDFVVQCDIIDPQHFGNHMKPILRIITTEMKPTETNRAVTISFDMPMYFPVCKSRVDYINIEITDMKNTPVLFNGGKTNVLLHFRRPKHKSIKEITIPRNPKKMDFYVILSSNTKTISDFVNTLTHFEVNLARPIELETDYEVGLAEVSYTKSWYNVPENYEIRLKTSDPQFKYPVARVYAGYYDTASDLCNAINREIKRNAISKVLSDTPPVLVYDQRTNTIEITAMRYQNQVATFKFPDYLGSMLGLEMSRPYLRHENIKEEPSKHVDMSGGIHNLYIYSNIVKNRIVGNSFSQLVRVIDIPNKASFGEQVTLHYNNPHYIPVNTNTLRDIEILILDDSGAKIPFTHGRTTVTLHFRPITKVNYE